MENANEKFFEFKNQINANKYQLYITKQKLKSKEHLAEIIKHVHGYIVFICIYR